MGAGSKQQEFETLNTPNVGTWSCPKHRDMVFPQAPGGIRKQPVYRGNTMGAFDPAERTRSVQKLCWLRQDPGH